jgi:hypothetical protein
VLELFLVIFSLQPDPVRLFNLNTKLPGSHAHGIVDLLSEGLVALVVDHYPLVLLEVNGMLDGKPSQSSFVTSDDLVALEDLGRAEDVCAHGLRVSFKLESPIFDALLIEELLHHLADLPDLILRSNSGLSQGVTHASTFPYFFGNSINEAEFRRQVEVFILILDQE